jgi:hypothetical protein
MANLKSTQKVILVQKFILLIFQFLGWKKNRISLKNNIQERKLLISHILTIIIKDLGVDSMVILIHLKFFYQIKNP